MTGVTIALSSMTAHTAYSARASDSSFKSWHTGMCAMGRAHAAPSVNGLCRALKGRLPGSSSCSCVSVDSPRKDAAWRQRLCGGGSGGTTVVCVFALVANKLGGVGTAVAARV